ncbi:MAG: hypothetical protein J5658_09085 [Prevotella sp.]|nr:hypothetical protein [Prevotella sp.]
MTKEEIKKIVDDERAEQLTAQLCRHWEVATQRLAELVQDLEANMDTCVEAEVYAAVMRMQSSVMALMELNKMPCALLFSEYLDRISQTVSNTSIRQSVMMLAKRLFTEQLTKGRHDLFFELVVQTMVQHAALPKEKQGTILEKVSPMQQVFALFAQYLQPEDLMMVASLIQEISAENDAGDQEETIGRVKDVRQAMDTLAGQMGENWLNLLICLLLLVLLPGLMVSMFQQKRTDSKAMAQLFNKVLLRVRESSEWWEYWKDRRQTLRVVNDDLSLKEIMKAEQGKERAELGKVPGGLFAKWTTDREAFDEEFLDAHLSDDDLRHFIFHLATLSEIARELDPKTKFGEEQLVNDNLQRVGEAVMAAARKLNDLVAEAWFPHYEAMWLELIKDETIFAHLKVTRKSQHNNLFTARFFCHLVGEMKKSAVFGASSDNDLAEKLTEKRYAGTFRKNIQEGMGDESADLQKVFNTIYEKYNALAYPKQ